MPDYTDVYPRVARLLREAGASLTDADLDDDLDLAARAALLPLLAAGQTWQQRYASLAGDDKAVVDQAVALRVAADLLPGLRATESGEVESFRQGSVSFGFSRGQSNATDDLSAQWRRRAASLLSSLSAAPRRTAPGSFFGASGPSRRRCEPWR